MIFERFKDHWTEKIASFFLKRYQLQQSTENTEISEKSEILWFVQNFLTGQMTEQLRAPAVLTDILGVCHSTHIAAHNHL